MAICSSSSYSYIFCIASSEFQTTSTVQVTTALPSIGAGKNQKRSKQQLLHKLMHHQETTM